MTHIYRESLALLTDLYELTMAYGYWKKGLADREAVFHLFFRKRPFGGHFAIAAGLQTVMSYIEKFRFDPTDLAYLEQLKAEAGAPLFEKKFLDYLAQFSFNCDVYAVPEGTPVFPYEPLIRVQGPIIQAQLLESVLLNVINFQTLIATKAARICFAAKSDAVIEFGLRRAQGIDGALSASRAAYIGGCSGTSNVLASKLYGIPVKGTHAHSWVMAFENEETAFSAWSETMPHNSMFLVDTYDSIEGTKKAIAIGKKLKKEGIDMLGVRLDSGDLAYLSIEIRKLLNESGFPHAKIMASNELDEFIINDLKHQGAQVGIWGVGTNLVTAKDQPALDGVYKLSAVRNEKGDWEYKIKLSEQLAKMTDPGILQVRRYYDERGNIADMIYDIQDIRAETKEQNAGASVIVDMFDPTRVKKMGHHVQYRDLLLPIFKGGKKVYSSPTLQQMQMTAKESLDRFSPTIRRFLYPQLYFTGLEKGLYEKKLALIEKKR